MEFAEYRLRAELRGHDEDVRALCVCELGIVTASRDKTVKIWVEGDDKKYRCTQTLVGHTDYVTALAYDSGCLVSGSRDKSVIIWDLGTASPFKRLEGHVWAVTAVAIAQNGDIVSASLDKTIRIWRDGACIKVLEGHTDPVQCLLILPNGAIVSGSNDTTIRVWMDGQSTVFKGHTDTVRGLALIPEIGVVSASHDMTLRVWDFYGECLSVLVGHTALVYAAAAAPLGFIASASEDNTARIWNLEGTLLQTLDHPGCVWDVDFLPNADLVTACSDHAAHVFTADLTLQADGDQLAAFTSAVEMFKEAGKKKDEGVPEGLKTEDPSALLTMGNRNGAQKFIKEAGGIFVYVWSGATATWEKMGQVTSGPEAADTVGLPNRVHGGQRWDFVVPVEMDGHPGLTLAFNRDENPYDVADRFLLDNEMSPEFRGEIVAFILENTGRAGAALPSVPSTNVDPFTGGGAYVPGSGGPQPGGGFGAGSGGNADPFTGVGAYVPNAAAPPAAPAAAPAAPPAHIPATAFVIFNSTPKLAGAAGKIREFNGVLAASPQTAALALTPDESAADGPIEGLLQRAAEGARAPGATTLTPADHALLGRLLRWPQDQLFPALDIARMAALDSTSAAALAVSGSLAPALQTAAGQPGGGHTGPTLLTALRFLCNSFCHAPLRALAVKDSHDWLDAFGAGMSASPANIRQAWAAFLLNLAILYASESETDEAGKAQLLSALSEILSGPVSGDDPETTYRALVAVGTLARLSKETASFAADLGVKVAAAHRRSLDGKLGQAAAELCKILA